MNKEKQISILKTAIKRFTKHGLNKTTLDEVARDMRLGKATLYHYFESKEALFLASVEYECSIFLEEIKLLFDAEGKDLSYKLLNYYKLKRDFFSRHKLLYDILLLFFTETISDNEKQIINNLLTEETKLVKELLKDIFNTKNENIIFELPIYFVKNTWGEIFSPKLNELIASNEDAYFDILQREIAIITS
ncbi:MAG: TetR/AcrR family transcriptional regulator [Bacteroidota bacterium]|nr:TetR/AcrR family transcriptional regulator [Bacteroidota bacterium]